MNPTVKRVLIIVLVVLALAFLGLVYACNRASRRSIAGLPNPKQTETTGQSRRTVGNYDVFITYKYEYEIEALVVHTNRHHWFSLEDRLSPIDVALAWGDVAEYNDRIDFHWDQSGRFYYWKVDSAKDLELIGDSADVVRQSSNNHLIPSTSSLRWKMKRIMPGDHIKIKGYLVNVTASNSKNDVIWWNSSTIRSDTGDGACELIYVTDLEFLD